jgi:hypothetical protein
MPVLRILIFFNRRIQVSGGALQEEAVRCTSFLAARSRVGVPVSVHDSSAICVFVGESPAK